MPNPRLASRYAKSLIDLAIEQGQVEVVYTDMKYLQAVCKASKEFMNFLVSPIIKADKKEAIISAVTKGNIGELTEAFVKLLIVKGRESDLYEIAGAFVNQYNELKNIHLVKLTTAVEVSDDLKQSIQTKVNAVQTGGSVELETKVDANIIGGFVLEFDNKLIDASVLRDLNDVKKQFMKNYYVQAMR